MVEGSSTNLLVPQIDCFVTHPEYKNLLGRVVDHKTESDSEYVNVQWGTNGTHEWHPVSELRNGFRRGHVVQDKPRSNTRRTLGTGTVIPYLPELRRSMGDEWHPVSELRNGFRRGHVVQDKPRSNTRRTLGTARC